MHTGSDEREWEEEREWESVTGGGYLAVAVAISHTSKLILKKMIHKSNSGSIRLTKFTKKLKNIQLKTSPSVYSYFVEYLVT